MYLFIHLPSVLLLLPLLLIIIVLLLLPLLLLPLFLPDLSRRGRPLPDPTHEAETIFQTLRKGES